MTTKRDDPFEATLRSLIVRYTEDISVTRDGEEALEELITQMVSTGHEEKGVAPLDDDSVQNALGDLDLRLKDARAILLQREPVALDVYGVQEIARGICPLPPICYESGEAPDGSLGADSDSEMAEPVLQV